MSVYIWSDLHLGHANIIKYCNRPFDTIEEMDSALVHSWFSIVKPEDTIINLGDVVFKNWTFEKLKMLINKMPGYKVLIIGNHDKRHDISWWANVGFNEVYNKSIVYEIEGNKYLLSHEPIINNDTGFYNLHGHIHATSYEQAGIGHNQFMINCSVENIGYKPILVSSLIK